MRVLVFFAICAVTFLSGCASIVNGVNQPVSVVAKSPESGDVVGARCTLTNSKGEWYTTTPGSVVVHRAYGDLAVNCVHPAYVGVTSVKSTTKGMAFGNIIFGGLIGAGIDAGNGSAYDYPDMISVSMIGNGQPGTQAAPLASKPEISQPLAPAIALPAAVPTVATTTAPATAPAPGSSPAVPALQPQAVPLATPVSVTSVSVVAVAKGGQDGYNAERLAKAQSCSAAPIARLTAKGPGFENYTVACENGDALALRCEFGNCRVLK